MPRSPGGRSSQAEKLKEALLKAPRGAAKVPLAASDGRTNASRRWSRSSSTRSDRTWKDLNSRLLELKPVWKRGAQREHEKTKDEDLSQEDPTEVKNECREEPEEPEEEQEDLRLSPKPKRACGPPAEAAQAAPVSTRALHRALPNLRRHCEDCGDGIRTDPAEKWSECRCGGALGPPEAPKHGKRHGRREREADTALQLLRAYKDQLEREQLEASSAPGLRATATALRAQADAADARAVFTDAQEALAQAEAAATAAAAAAPRRSAAALRLHVAPNAAGARSGLPGSAARRSG